MARKHSSSGSPKRGRLWLLLAINSIAVLVVGALVTVAVQQGRGKGAATSDETCKQTGSTHQLRLKNDSFSTSVLSVKQCDKIIITNDDELSYSLHFGQHDNHITYLGYQPSTLIQNEQLEIVMREVGTYTFHDHFRDNATISLAVARRQ